MVVKYIIWHTTILIHGFLFVKIHLLLLCFWFQNLQKKSIMSSLIIGQLPHQSWAWHIHYVFLKEVGLTIVLKT